MYASSFGNGILLYQSGNSEGPLNITTEDGLLSNFVFSAIEDDKGDIWISTYRGLNKYIPTTGDVIGWSYDRIGKDVLFSEGAPLISTGGDIVFNTNAGILHFNPDDISNSTYTPKLFLTSCQFAGGRIYPETDSKIEVRGNGRLSLRFAAVDLNGPERVTYFWRIDGKDGEEWGQLGNRPVLNLDNLEAGRHLLQLKSTNADGIPVGNTLDIEILVKPDKRKYTQVLALLLLTALTASAFVLFSRRKARKVSHPATGSIEQSAGKDPDANTEVGSGYEEQNPEEQRFVRVFKAFLEENMDNGDINAEDMATALGVSRSVLFERCRTLLGKAPTEYLRDLRFSKAAEMMAEDRYSISQIAYKTGFNDSHYFSKAFKKRFGVSPTEYRKSVKGS